MNKNPPLMMRPNHSCLAASVLALSVSLLACADEVKPPKTGPAMTSGRAAPAATDRNAKSDDDGRAGAIVVDEEIARLCDLPAAHFAFDRSDIGQGASQALDALVACLSVGPLKGRALKLVGHADSRGELEYNFALGQRRAGSVEEYMQEHGIPSSNMVTSSRGELEATGNDTASWAKDRKVEVLLAKHEAP
jgi:peptidoglycan-associated lipoprotein